MTIRAQQIANLIQVLRIVCYVWLVLAMCEMNVAEAENRGSRTVSDGSKVAASSLLAKRSLADVSGLAQQKAIYNNVTLIGGKSSHPVERMAILVGNDTILNIVPVDQVTPAMLEEATVYDMDGQFALPGLIDSHVHLATLPDRPIASAYLRRFLYGGITDVRDMAGDVRALADLSRAALINEIPAPDIHYTALMAGPSFFSDPRTVTSGLGGTPGQLPWMQAIDRDSDIRLMVAQAKGTWATGIKIYANLPGEIVQSIITEAKTQNMPIWSHLQVYPATPYDSLGATAVSHVCMIARYAGERNKQRYGHDNPPSYENVSAEHPEIQNYVASLAKSGTIMDATLVLYKDLAREYQAAIRHNGQTPLRRPRCSLSLAADITRAMNEAGVPIIAGTDGFAPPDQPFPKLYEELALLVEQAGLTPRQAIAAATINAANALGKGNKIGSLEPGKLANIVFLNENPLADIRALYSINLTVKRGHRFPRKDYQHEIIPELIYPE